ncbi:membrane protein [Vallitalea longa]|uniref:Membrane protein n=1 Tax=Vallitalea longa TaxID=2936439 RepID=A0A9W5YC10_9FIRM|nr:DUF998 domain-containing protein [Vallitalea longa]GKX31240.1 membrane protein [Vallitalea longa]
MKIIFILVMLLDLLIPFLIAIPYKGYNHLSMVMSVLGCKKSPLHKIYNMWFLLSGCIIALLGYYIFDTYKESHRGLAVTIFILIVIYGIGDEVISGIFPINEKKEEVTLSSTIHGIGSVIGFMSLQFAPLIFGILQLKVGQTSLGISSFVFFIISFVIFIFFVMGEKPKFQGTIFALNGLWQRVLCTLLYMPFIIWLISIM